MPTGPVIPTVAIEQVALLIDDTDAESARARAQALAEAAVPLLTLFAKSHTRGRGFDAMGEPNAEIAAAITTAAVRFAANCAQTSVSHTIDDATSDVRSWFTGWTLPELVVLNRYRVRAM